jgi:hypothetical protein
MRAATVAQKCSPFGAFPDPWSCKKFRQFDALVNWCYKAQRDFDEIPDHLADVLASRRGA